MGEAVIGEIFAPWWRSISELEKKHSRRAATMAAKAAEESAECFGGRRKPPPRRRSVGANKCGSYWVQTQSATVDDEEMEICRRTVEWVYDMAITEATIRTRQGDRIVIRCTAKDDVKIKRTCQKQLQL